MFAVGHAECERVVVLRRVVGKVVFGGRKHFDTRASEIERPAAAHRHDLNASRRGMPREFAPERFIGIGSRPELGRMKIVEYGAESSGVVLVSVGSDYHVEMTDGPGPEVG